jgi:sugar/nucleoside kinase (ribokinase family)
VSARSGHVAVVAASARLIESLGPMAFHERAAGANVVIANAEEARMLTDLDPAGAVGALARRYRVACVTAGEDGAFAATGSEIVQASVEWVPGNTTGAGDALAGVLLVSLVRGLELRPALEAACAAALTAIRSPDRTAPGG